MEKGRNAVYHNGKVVYYLNEKLLILQKVTDQELSNLVQLHQEKLAIFGQMEATDNRNELRRLAGLIETIEFEMQENWHFPLNRDFHEWYKVPKCTCPRFDNEERRGTAYQVINVTCPIHGEPR